MQYVRTCVQRRCQLDSASYCRALFTRDTKIRNHDFDYDSQLPAPRPAGRTSVACPQRIKRHEGAHFCPFFCGGFLRSRGQNTEHGSSRLGFTHFARQKANFCVLSKILIDFCVSP